MATSFMFSSQLVTLFGEASGDKNPLHLSDLYARKTAFGQPVVFGALGALVGLAGMENEAQRRVSGMTADFRGPMLVDVPYATEISAGNPARFRLRDGQRTLLQASFQLGDGPFGSIASLAGERPGRTAAREWREEELDHAVVEGRWAPSFEHARALAATLGLADGGSVAVIALLWASHVVGMEIPGRDALFVKLALELTPSDTGTGAPLDFVARVIRLDRRFSRVVIDVELRQSGRRLARGTLEAFVREALAPVSQATLDQALPRSDRMHGKVALVIGGSRGLGASLCHALARSGCRVAIGFQKSAVEAEALRDALGASAEDVMLAQGDASDPAYCQRTADACASRFGRLDALVLSACRPVMPMRLEPETTARLADYVKDNVALVSAPLAACAPLLSQSKGCVVALSSSYVKELPADFPHYIAAKQAIEGLVHAASRQHADIGYVIARPPRLHTDLTNAPLSRAQALPPEVAAARIRRALLDPPPAGSVVLVEDFA